MVADLEDAVTPGRKDAARELVLQLRPPVVRVNGAGTPWFADDLAAAAELELVALVLPRATDMDPTEDAPACRPARLGDTTAHSVGHSKGGIDGS